VHGQKIDKRWEKALSCNIYTLVGTERIRQFILLSNKDKRTSTGELGTTGRGIGKQEYATESSTTREGI